MLNIVSDSSLVCKTRSIIQSEIEKRGREVIFLVPEYAKASTERIVINSIQEKFGIKPVNVGGTSVTSSLVNGDVLSFMRLSGRLLEIAGRPLSGAGDNTIMRNAVYSVLIKHDDEFKTFNRLKFRFEYIDMIIDLLGDFYRYGITEDDVCDVLENISDDEEILENKLSDLKVLMGYLEELGDEYGLVLDKGPIDGACSLLKEIIAASGTDSLDRNTKRARDFVKNKFAVLGFGTTRLLTPQELEFVRLLSDAGAEIDFYLISDTESTARIYDNGNATVEMLAKSGTKYVITDVKNQEEINPLQKTSVNYALEETAPEEKTDRIISVDIKDRDDRIAYTANEIIRLTREEGYRYKDIRIVCVDDDMMSRFRSVMKTFGLDIFVDEVFALNNSPVIRYSECLLMLPIHNYSLDLFLKLMRTGVAGVLMDDADLFDNYCTEFNLTSDSKIFDEESYQNSQRYFYRDGRLINTGDYLYKNVVERVLQPVREISQEISNEDRMTAKAELLGRAIEKVGKDVLQNQIQEAFDNGRSDEAATIAAGYNELMKLMAAFTSEMNEVDISQQQFIDLIKIDMRNKAVSSIPLKVDSIEINTPSQALMTDCRAMFILGEKSDNFPYRGAAEGLMTNDELMLFSDNLARVKLPDKIAARTKTDFISSALMMTSVTDRLYFVHEEGVPDSSVYEYFKSVGTVIKKECFTNPVVGVPSGVAEDLSIALITDEHMDQLIGDELRVSVSSLETYNECHFRYMLKNMLKIREREDTTEIKATDIGTVAHAMYENIFGWLKEEYKSSSELKAFADSMSSDDVQNLVDRSFEAAKKELGIREKDSEIFDKNPGINAKRIVKRSLQTIISESADNGFVPDEFEFKIGGEDDPSIMVDGKSVKFNGSIDRVDRSDRDGSYRIIDYKTGDKSIDYEKLYNGLQIQLPLYMRAFEKHKGEGAVVSNAGYIQMNIKPVKANQSLDFMPKLYGLDRSVLQKVCDYAEYVLNESCKGIIHGEAGCAYHELTKSYCDNCHYSVICCRSKEPNPKNQLRMDESFEELDKLKADKKLTAKTYNHLTSIYSILKRENGDTENE